MVSRQIKREIAIIFSIFILAAIFLFFYFNPSLTGFAVADKLPSIKIDSVCYYEAENYDIWNLNNKNDFEIVYNWDILNSGKNGSGIALPGLSYLNTTRKDTKDKIRIFVNSILVQSKKNSIKPCVLEIPIEEPIENASQNQTIPDIEQNISEQNQTLNQTNQTGVIQNQTIENITEIILPEENQTAINESYGDIPENQTIINETQINETLDLNETINLNATDNETIETTIIQITSGGVSGDSGSGGVYYPPDKSIKALNTSLNKENKTSSQNITLSEEIIDSSANKIEEPVKSTKFISIVGNAIKIPLDSVKALFVNKSIVYYLVFSAVILIMAVIIFFLIRYFRKRKQDLNSELD